MIKVEVAFRRVNNIAKQAIQWISENIPENYKKKFKLKAAVEKVQVKMQVLLAKSCASDFVESSDQEKLRDTLEGLRNGISNEK